MQNLQDDLKQMLKQDKSLLHVNCSEIDDANFEVSESDKKLNETFYGLKK